MGSYLIAIEIFISQFLFMCFNVNADVCSLACNVNNVVNQSFMVPNSPDQRFTVMEKELKRIVINARSETDIKMISFENKKCLHKHFRMHFNTITLHIYEAQI